MARTLSFSPKLMGAHSIAVLYAGNAAIVVVKNVAGPHIGGMLAMLLVAQMASPPPNGHGPVPAVDPAAWILADDYPAEALRNDQEGKVSLTLKVDKSGKATACRVEVSSGVQALDDAGCAALMARASFRPARNARGQAVAGQWSRNINWAIPRGVDSRALPITFVSEPGGARCQALDHGRLRYLARQWCDALVSEFQKSGRQIEGTHRVEFPDRPDIFELEPAVTFENSLTPPN